MFHLDGLVPVRLGDAVQQPPQRRDAPGADREEDVLVVRGAGNLPGEIPGVDAGGDAAAGPGPLRQGAQRAAQQIRRARPRVIGPGAQVSGQHDLGLGPRGHMRAAHALPLTVIGHATFLAAVDLHVGGVQVDGDRPFGQRCGPRRGRQVQHPRRDRRQAGLHGFPLPCGDPPGHARGGGRTQPGHRRQQLPGRIGALPVQACQEILPGQLRRRDPGQQLPGTETAIRCLTGPTAASRASITPSRSHNSLTAASPALGVSAASGAPIRAGRRFRFLPRILATR